MPINVKSVYSKDRILKYNYYIASSKKLFWSLMIAANIIAIIPIIVDLVYPKFQYISSATVLLTTILVMMDIMYPFVYFVLPRITINKVKNLNTVIDYSFDSDAIHITASNSFTSETSVTQYSIISKIRKNGDDVYLIISPNQAYIVDLSQILDNEILSLKELLYSKVDPKKIKWS